MRYRGTPAAGSPEWDEATRLLLLMLCPAAPHVTEELWSRRLAAAGAPWSSIHVERWPDVDPNAITESTREVPIQVNGKLRDKLTVPATIDGAELERLALASPKIAAILAGRTPDRIVAAGGGRLLNIVLRDA
jgi:leucyl-tRNA synthetase